MNGGEIARGGFIYQDWAAAYFFLISDVDRIDIEKHEDFSFSVIKDDTTIRRFFQAKSSDNGSLGWTKFRTDIIPNFYELCEVFDEKEAGLRFEIVANYKPSKNLKDFLDDLKKFRKNQIGRPRFKTKYERRLDAIESAIERQNDINNIDSNTYDKVLNGIHYHFYSLGELESRVEQFIKDCRGGRTDYAKEEILTEIRTTDSGTISKRDIESNVGFRLEQVEQTTYHGSPSEVRSEAKDIYQRYSQESPSVSKPATDKRKIQDYVELLNTQTTKWGEEQELETSETNVKQGFENAEQAQREYKSATQDIEEGLKNLFELDSEIGDDI